MRRVLIILFSLIAFANIAKADKVTEQQALEKAKSFMAGKRFLARSGTRGLNSTLQDTHFYVFNTEDNNPRQDGTFSRQLWKFLKRP